MEKLLAHLENASVRYQEKLLLQDINLSITKGQNTVVTGASGSGKTLLGKLIAGQLLPTTGTVKIDGAAKPIGFVTQQQSFRTAFSPRSYYQNRYEVNNDSDIPVVQDYLLKTVGDISQIENLLEEFSLTYILKQKFNQLSNGEGKRLQIIMALAQRPPLIILDNPFIGVDAKSRELLLNMLDKLKSQNTTWILLSDTQHIPNSTSFIIELEKGCIISKKTKDDFTSGQLSSKKDNAGLTDRIFPKELSGESRPDFDIAVALKNVTVRYGEVTVLNNLTWTVKRSERWLIKGSNGSGKSMLLSLMNGDNPKAFGNDIILFDQPKGSGESIWELKAKIGYMSPEMHMHFLRMPPHVSELVADEPADILHNKYQSTITCEQVIASGFTEETGAAATITAWQAQRVKTWMDYLQINQSNYQLFVTASLGLQRLILLARALVRQPPLLILDEPCQGLDDEQTFLFKHTVEQLCDRFGTTLLYVSHYDHDVPKNMTHLLELEKGQIKFSGLMNK